VASYFFDSSALVKRYATETGSAWVDSLTDPRVGNRVYVAAITHVEVVAAIAQEQEQSLLLDSLDSEYNLSRRFFGQRWPQ
jgi:predicted nucleic acid-binding protein